MLGVVASVEARRDRSRRAQPRLGRAPLAAVRGRALRARDGRSRAARRGGSVPRRPARCRAAPMGGSSCRGSRATAPPCTSTAGARSREPSRSMGSHGLPLLGSGDWNDALDRAGAQGARRERLARLLPARRARRLSPSWRTSAGARARATPIAPRRSRLRTALAAHVARRALRARHHRRGRGARVRGCADVRVAGALGRGRLRAGTHGRRERAAPARARRSRAAAGAALRRELAARTRAGSASIRRACARTAGSTRTASPGWSTRWSRLSRASPRPRGSATKPRGCGPAPSRSGSRSLRSPRWTPRQLDRYGVSPHQQPADVYFGPGYDGRGGWSWYTGGAARMLSAAYAILGLELRDGELVVPENLFEPKGPLALKRLDVSRAHVRGAALKPCSAPRQAPRSECTISLQRAGSGAHGATRLTRSATPRVRSRSFAASSPGGAHTAIASSISSLTSRGHLLPAPALRERVQLGLERSPAARFEHQPIGRRRAVEGDLRAHGGARALELLVVRRRSRSSAGARSGRPRAGGPRARARARAPAASRRARTRAC